MVLCTADSRRSGGKEVTLTFNQGVRKETTSYAVYEGIARKQEQSNDKEGTGRWKTGIEVTDA